MTLEQIKQILEENSIENNGTHYLNDDAVIEIYKLHLQDKLNLIGELTEFNKLSPRLFWKLEKLSKLINNQILELKDK